MADFGSFPGPESSWYFLGDVVSSGCLCTPPVSSVYMPYVADISDAGANSAVFGSDTDVYFGTDSDVVFGS